MVYRYLRSPSRTSWISSVSDREIAEESSLCAICCFICRAFSGFLVLYRRFAFSGCMTTSITVIWYWLSDWYMHAWCMEVCLLIWSCDIWHSTGNFRITSLLQIIHNPDDYTWQSLLITSTKLWQQKLYDNHGTDKAFDTRPQEHQE